MSDIVEHTFRTKTGTCTITSEQIILAREGVRGATAQWMFGYSIHRTLVIYSLLGGTMLILGISFLLGGDIVEGGLVSLVGAFFLRTVISSRNNSAAPVINRSTIRTVEAHPPRPPITRGYFVVWFEEEGKTRNRLIMLPGSMANGQEEYVRAEAAMRATGLLSSI